MPASGKGYVMPEQPGGAKERSAVEVCCEETRQPQFAKRRNGRTFWSRLRLATRACALAKLSCHFSDLRREPVALEQTSRVRSRSKGRSGRSGDNERDERTPF